MGAATLTTLKARADFLRLNRGRKYITDFFILRYGHSGLDGIRVGYTVTTKCGNAVVRNRIKRRLRALVREVAAPLAKPGMDYVLIARSDAKPGVADADITALSAAVKQAFERAQ